MEKYIEDSGYELLMMNAKRFKREQRTHHTIMEIQLNEEIKEIIDVIDDLTVDYNELQQKQLPELLSYVSDELNKTYFFLLRSAVLQPKNREFSDNDANYHLDVATQFYRSEMFRSWVEEDEGRKTRMDIYNFLMDGDREDLAVRAAFVKVEDRLKQFFKLNDEVKFSRRVDFKKDRRELRQSVYKLVHACGKCNVDGDNCKAVLGKLGVMTIYDCLCKDLLKERLRGKRVKRMFTGPLFR